MNGEPSSGHVDFATWLFRVLTWDGVLPLCMTLVPSATLLLFPNNRWPFVIVAVGLPIAGLFIRIRAGCHHIDENNCSPTFQKIQVWSMLFGAFILVFIDTILILMHEIGPAAFLAQRGWVVVVWTLLIYLTAMAVAMYPGRSKPLPTTLQLESPP